MMPFKPSDRFQGQLCTRCGICSSICPVGAVSVDGQGRPADFSSLCIGCGHCGCYCPSNCFGLEPATGGKLPDGEAMDLLFMSRRSTRRFVQRDLTDWELEAVLKPLDWTPTGHNDQGLTVRVIAGRDRVEELLVKRFSRILRFVDSFRLLTLIAGPGREFIRRLRSGEDLLAWGAPCVVLFTSSMRSATPVQDSLIAAAAVAMKAESMGLGTLWGGFIRFAAPLAGLGRCHTALCIGDPALRKHQAVPARSWKRVDL